MSERQGRYRVKRDANQSEIEQALTAAGYVWHDTSKVGGGFPDLVVKSKSGVIVLFEIKGPEGRLTADEMEFSRKWDGAPLVVIVSGRGAIYHLEAVDALSGIEHG